MNKKAKRHTKNQEAEAEIQRLTQMNAAYLKNNSELLGSNNTLRGERECLEENNNHLSDVCADLESENRQLRANRDDACKAVEVMAIVIAGLKTPKPKNKPLTPRPRNLNESNRA